MSEFLLPDVGEGLTEAEIVSWLVKVGDVVKVNDVLVEIETAKSLVELPSPYAGPVSALLVEEGETVAVGTPIIRIGSATEGGSNPDSSAPDGGSAHGATADESAQGADAPLTLVGYGPRSGAARRRARRGPATAATEAGAATQIQVQGVFEQPGVQTTTEVVPADEPVVPSVSAPRYPDSSVPDGGSAHGASADESGLAKPMVRLRARELGIDLATVTGSGPGGSVTLADLEAAGGRVPRPEVLSTGPEDRREPVKGVRKVMAQAMVASAFAIPHVTEWVEVDVTRTMKLAKRRGLSPLVVVARAVCLAIRRTPEVNAVWDEAAQEVVFRGAVNLGIAAATPRGLVVPNIKSADAMGLAELKQAIGDLTGTARDGRTAPADQAGGTFTITNVGVFGVNGGTPIINPGESAILCIGSIRPKPWVHRGKVRVREVTTLALSFDHRFIDGAAGSRFLADVAAVVQDPASAL